MRNKNWILAAVWLLSSGWVCAGSETPKARYSVDVWQAGKGLSGLPENTVIALTQTQDGYLWVGTLDGLARFDGVQFSVFNQANTPG